MEELLEKIPVEKRWAITANFLAKFLSLRGEKAIAPGLGKGEGYILPVLGAEKWREINARVFSDGAKQMFPWVKETFNIPVADAIGAAKLLMVWAALAFGPQMEMEIVEATPERAVFRWTKCTWWELWKEFELDLEFLACHYTGHQPATDAGFKAINPRITCKPTKQMSKRDSYCEDVIEFKDE